jgi:urea ABC transporter permease protein UrtB
VFIGEVRADGQFDVVWKTKGRCARSRGARSSPATRLLAALGLAITYGLMGVINMAHGELIMIGAYATLRGAEPVPRYLRRGWFDWYLRRPCRWPSWHAALVGMVMERSVIRWLYGRPLETLLATWGISLMLIQAVRSPSARRTCQVENPSWMSGGVQVMSNLTLPYNRIASSSSPLLVLLGMWLLLARTRLGLFVRGVTQNRPWRLRGREHRARGHLAFGLGSGIAGLAGCALSQVGNVGPDLGQGYIVDSFMVVVLGGVGQLAGTVYAALGLGVFNKFIEPAHRRGARQDRGAGVHHHLHPEAAAGAVRPEGAGGRELRARRMRMSLSHPAAAGPKGLGRDRLRRCAAVHRRCCGVTAGMRCTFPHTG